MIMIGLNACNKINHKKDIDYTFKDKDKKDSIPKNCYLWFDASANFKRFSNTENIKYYVQKAKQTGFTHIIVDVRPIVGDVLYKSDICKELIKWKGNSRDSNQDYLQEFINEAKKANLKIFASINVFVGGHNYFDEGIAYRDDYMGKKSTLLYLPQGMTDIRTVKKKYSAFFNPVDKEIQNYCLSIIKELTEKYDIDGLILDRCRFDSLDSDFSDLSKSEFEKYIGKTIEEWPCDIFYWENKNDKWERKIGKYFNQWLVWRAKIIHDFFEDARNIVKSTKPNVLFGTYTGAWYPVYYDVGANWASNKYDPQLDYSYSNWMYNSDYKKYGFADLLDVYFTGVYYTNVYGNDWYSIQGGLINAKRIIKNEVPVNGSLYAYLFRNNPEKITEAIKVCLQNSDGIMIFDIVQVIEYNLWDEVGDGIKLGLAKK